MNKKTAILSLLIPLLIIGCSSKEPESKNDSSSDATSFVSSENKTSSISSEQVSSSNSGSEKQSSNPTSSEDKSSSSSIVTVPVESVSLNESCLELFSNDTSVSLTATVLPENATNKSVTWSSSDGTVATVTNGNITPIKAGEATITATTVDGNKTALCELLIKDPTAVPNYVLHGAFNSETDWTNKSMVNNPYSTTEYMILGVELHANDVFKIHMYGDAWYGYSAIKSSVKTGLVTDAGTDDNIKVLTTGVYDIYCDYNKNENGHIYLNRVDETDPTPSTVNVSGISLSHSGKYMLVRNEFTITPTVYPNNATNKEVIWTSSDTSIATVTSSGRVVASVNSKVGSTTITAKTVDGGFTATCVVYVSTSQYPDYCLTGTIGGKSRSGISMRYAAVPLSKGKYLIPDVDLIEGDEVTVTDNYGARLKDKLNQIYKKEITKNMSVNVYLDVNNANYDYLTFETKAGN